MPPRPDQRASAAVPQVDAIVIGGGLVGAAIAYGLALEGLRVTVVDEGDRAFRAARGNFGLVWVQGKGAGLPAYAALTKRSADLAPGLAAQIRDGSGLDVGLTQPGGLHLCHTQAELDRQTQALHRMHNQPGGGNDWQVLTMEEVRRLIPDVGPIAGATWGPHDGHLDPLRLLYGLHQQAQAQGVQIETGVTIDSVAASPGGGFDLKGGTRQFGADRVVFACGLGIPALAAQVGLTIPLSPQRGQIVVTARMPHLLDYPTTTLRQTSDGTVMLGDSQEQVGFDDGTTVTVSQHIARRAVTALPALRQARVIRTWGALRVMAPDGFPIYAQSPTAPGAFVIACHSGVTLSAAHAYELAPAIASGDLSGYAEFSPDRFAPGPARG